METRFDASLRMPKETLVGGGILDRTEGRLGAMGRKALVVTGPHVGRSPMMDRLRAALTRDCVECVIFDGITSEPTDSMIARGVELYRAGGCDFCVGLGGGSPLDAAKAIAAMTVLPGKIADYLGRAIEGPLPDVVAIPTTAGTGSEATKFTIITDAERDVKMLLKGDSLVPSLAVVDYTMTMTSPAGVTASTGLDALTHAIESFISVKASPATDALALEAVRRIIKWLPVAYADGSSARARELLAEAAFMAGVCLNNSSVTVVHGMSRPIGAHFHVPHGISNAMLLTTCLADMLDHARERYARLARAAGVAGDLHSDEAAAQALLEAVAELCATCGVPSLEGYGIDQAGFMAAIERMSADAIASGSPANAPKPYSAADCARLYRAAFRG